MVVVVVVVVVVVGVDIPLRTIELYLKKKYFKLISPFLGYFIRSFCSGFITSSIHSHHTYAHVFLPHLIKLFGIFLASSTIFVLGGGTPKTR